MVEKAQLLNLLMNSGHSRRIFVWAINCVRVCEVYFVLAELNEVLDQLRHFCGTFRRVSEIFRITPCFCSGGSSNVVDVVHTGVIWGCF